MRLFHEYLFVLVNARRRWCCPNRFDPSIPFSEVPASMFVLNTEIVSKV